MTVVTEARHAGEFLVYEDEVNFSRENITILSGEGVLPAGRLIGVVGTNEGAVTVGAPAFTGTGNGTLTRATPAYSSSVQEGTYIVRLIEAGSDAGSFQVIRPDGTIDGIAAVGTAYDGQVKFTIADGSTDFAGPAQFTLAVTIAEAAGASKWRSADPSNTDGSERAAGILLYPVDATSADVATVAVVRHAIANVNLISYDAGADTAPKKAALVADLKAKGVLIR